MCIRKQDTNLFQVVIFFIPPKSYHIFDNLRSVLNHNSVGDYLYKDDYYSDTANAYLRGGSFLKTSRKYSNTI